MKKIAVIILAILATAAFGVTALNGSAKWIMRKDRMSVVKVTIPYGATADETVTWDIDGMATRIVVDVNATDADADITITDISGANYVNLADKLGSGDIDYIISSQDADGNIYGGKPIAGRSTMRVADGAASFPATFYIYYR